MAYVVLSSGAVRWTVAFGVLVSGLVASLDVEADDATDEAKAAADQVTNPLPTQEQFGFKPMYQFPEGANRYKSQFEFEPVLPYQGVFIPDLTVDALWSIARLQLTGESLQNSSGTFGGLEDLNFLDGVASRFGPLTLGVGFGSVFPLATSPQLGQGKWQLGPAVFYRWDPFPAFKFGGVVQSLWSVAGSSQMPNTAYLSVQPFVTVHLPAALFFSSDATMKFFWAGGSTTVPVNLGFGHAFSRHFVGAAKCQVTVAGPEQGAVQGELDMIFLP